MTRLVTVRRVRNGCWRDFEYINDRSGTESKCIDQPLRARYENRKYAIVS